MRIAFVWIALIVCVGCSESTPTETQQAPTELPTVTLTEGTNLAFAASDSAIVLALQGRLFTTSLDGGDAVAIIEPGYDAREPSINRGADTVVFHGYANGTWDLWRVAITGGTPETLTKDAYDDREPHYANTSDAIVFASDRGGSYDIWLREENGELVQLTHEEQDAHSPSWSPDDSAVAFAVGTRGQPYHIKRLNLSDGQVTTLITEAGVVSGIAWDPAGTQLSYQLLSRTSSGFARTTLKRVAVDGGEPTVLTEPLDDVFPFRAHWLDDERILYAANGGIQRLTPDGVTTVPFKAEVTLNRPAYEKRRRDHDDVSERQAVGLATPAISNDGNTILFAALGDIWSWQPSTEQLTQITTGPAAEQNPIYMPDQRSILYVTDRNGPQQLVQHVLDSGLEQIIDTGSARTLSFPSVSPDGSQIAVFVDIPSNPMAGQLVVLDRASGAITPVGQPMPAQPSSWDASGEHLLTTRLNTYAKRYREGVYELVATELATGSETTTIPIAHKSTLSAALVPGADTVTYVQDGLLWRLELDEDGKPLEAPIAITDDLTDQPTWSQDGAYLVFSRGESLLRMDAATGALTDVTPDLSFAPKRGSGSWTLRVGRVFDGLSESYTESRDILIENNRITDIQPVDPDRTGEVVDMGEHTAIPGLFEMHAHMGTTSGMQGSVWLAYGVTSVRDPGAHPYVAKERQETWDAGASPGPRTYTAGFLTDGNRVYYSMAEGITSDDHLERALDRTKRLQLDLVKTYVRLPDHWQARVVEAAHAMGIPVSSHELYPAVANGVDHVEHIGGTSRRGYQPKVSTLGHSYQDVIALLSESGMGLTPTAVLPGFSVVALNDDDYFSTPQFQTFYGPQAEAGYKALVRRFGAADEYAANNGALLRALVANDALVVSGTDAPFVPYGAGLHAEFRLYARAGLTPAQVLRSATIKAAEAAHVENDLGSIEVGKVADIVVIDGDPLTRIEDADNVVMTVKGGMRFTLEELGVKQ